MITVLPVLTTVDLIRHGEPVGGRRYRGQLDDPLSPKGWQQMRAAVADHHPWQTIITSPLSRCREFAREVATRHDIPLVADARLQEIGFGSWEGKTAEELRARDPECIRRFLRDPLGQRPEGAEPLTIFRDRVINAWEAILQSCAGQQVLVVAHAGVIRMVLRHVLAMPLETLFRIQVGNASLTRICVERDAQSDWPRLIFHDGHL